MPGEAMRSRHVPPGRTEEGLSQREPPAWGLGPRAGPGSSLRKLGESSGDWLSEVGAGDCPQPSAQNTRSRATSQSTSVDLHPDCSRPSRLRRGGSFHDFLSDRESSPKSPSLNPRDRSPWMKRQCQMMQRTCYLFIPPHESSLHSAFNLWERSYPRLKHLPGKNRQSEKSMRRNKSCKTKVREEGAAPRAQGHGLVEGRARRQSRGRPSCCSRPQRPARTPGLQQTRRSTEQTASRTSEPPVGSCLAPRSGFREQYDGGQGPTLGPPRAASSQDSGPGSARLLLWPPGTPPRSAQPSPPPPGSQGVQPAWSPWPRWWRTCSSRWLIWPLTPVLDLDCSSSLLALDVGSPLCFTAPSCRQAGSLPPRPTVGQSETLSSCPSPPAPPGSSRDRPSS